MRRIFRQNIPSKYVFAKVSSRIEEDTRERERERFQMAYCTFATGPYANPKTGEQTNYTHRHIRHRNNQRGVRGHSPSRLTCTSAPTFCLDCCVFQRMLECDSCQCCVMDSVMQWWAVCAPASSRLLVFWILLLAWTSVFCCVMRPSLCSPGSPYPHVQSDHFTRLFAWPRRAQ